jgi:hypothetical protein
LTAVDISRVSGVRVNHSSYGARPAPIGSRVLVCLFEHHIEIRDLKTQALLRNFIAMSYLRLGKLTHLPTSPFAPALPQSRASPHVGLDVTVH